MAEPALHRGDVVVCAFSGDYGKPRPAVVVQADAFNETHASLTLCPITSDITGLDLFRVPAPAGDATGLLKDSEVMVDKIVTVKRIRVAKRIGRLLRAAMARVDAALQVWLQIGVDGDSL